MLCSSSTVLDVSLKTLMDPSKTSKKNSKLFSIMMDARHLYLSVPNCEEESDFFIMVVFLRQRDSLKGECHKVVKSL